MIDALCNKKGRGIFIEMYPKRLGFTLGVWGGMPVNLVGDGGFATQIRSWKKSCEDLNSNLIIVMSRVLIPDELIGINFS